MTERTRLISDLLRGLFSAILKMNTIKNNGNNFQHPRERSHSRSCSSNRHEVAARSKQRHCFLHNEIFWSWVRGQLKIGKWSADNIKNTSPQWVNTWARDTVMWHWSADSFLWQLPIEHNMDVHCQVLCLKTWVVCFGHLATNAR